MKESMLQEGKYYASNSGYVRKIIKIGYPMSHELLYEHIVGRDGLIIHKNNSAIVYISTFASWAIYELNSFNPEAILEKVINDK